MSQYGGPLVERYGKVARVKCITRTKSSFLRSGSTRVVRVDGYSTDGYKFDIPSGWKSDWPQSTFRAAFREWYGPGVSVIFEEF